MREPSGRPRKPTLAERREQRAAVEDPGEVVDAAARLLEARPRSVAEIRRRLTAAGYRTDLVAAAVERMTGLGFLDDAAFARAWVESRDRAHPRGEHALRQELRLKGIKQSLVDEILDERQVAGAGTDADLAAAEHLLERSARALARLTDPRLRRQRAYTLLARHGFSPSVAADVARRLVEGDEATDE